MIHCRYCTSCFSEFVVNGDHSLEANEVDNTSSEMIPSDGLGCQPVTPLTEISSEGASNTAIKLTKIPSDKAQPRVSPDGTSRSRIIFEEAMAKEATTFPPPPHNHKDTTPSRVVVPPDGLSFQPSLSGGARRVETNTASLPSNNQKDTPPSRTAGVHHPEAVNLPCKSDKDKTATRVPPEGVSNINPLVVALPIKNSNDRTQSGAKTPRGMISQPSSVTTDRAGNDDVKVVALPAKNGRTQSGATAPSGLSAQPSSVTTNAVPASNAASQAMSAAGHRIAGKSFSCPDDSSVAKKEECRDLKRYSSELLRKPMEKKRKFKPSKAILFT